MLPEVEKAKYRAGLTQLPASGRGGMRAWVPTSAPCLPSAAPSAPLVAPPSLPADLAQMVGEPIGLGAAPSTASREPPSQSSTTAVEVPVEMPPGFHSAAALANRLGGQLKAKRTISSSASATSSAYSYDASGSSDMSEPEPENAATHAPPPTRAAPPTPPPAQLAAPPPLPAPSDLPLRWTLQAVMNASLHATLTAPAQASDEEGSAESELMEAVLTDIMADEEVVLELQSIQGSLPAQANPETVAGVTVAEQPVIFHGVQGAADNTASGTPPPGTPPQPDPEWLTELLDKLDEGISEGGAKNERQEQQQANLGHGQINNMTPEQQAISVALSRIQVARTDVEVCKVARTLAYALGSTRVEVGTIKALHAVLLQMTRPGMSDMEAFTSTKASKTNFVLWKRKVLTHARGV